MSEPRFCELSDGTWAVVDPAGTPCSGDRYRAAGPFREGFATAYRFDGRAVLVDAAGREVPSSGRDFLWILPLQGGVALAATTSGEIGRLTSNGRFHTAPMNAEWVARGELTRVSHLLYERGYNVSLDGNVSWRLDDGNLLITPSGAHLGSIRPEDFVVVRPDGALLRGDRLPTSELHLHVELHRKRPDCRCVLHAHAPYAIAASLAGVDLRESYITVAPVPTTRYARISSTQTAEVLQPFMADYNWAILPRHGVVAWASTAWEAFLRVEGLEHCAKVLMTARACGPIDPLRADQRIELLTLWGLEHLG